MRRAIGGMLVIVSLCACAPGRIADLQDSAKLSLGGGIGLSADASLGFVSQPSIGLFSKGAMLGFEGRNAGGVTFQERVSFPYTFAVATRDGKSVLSALNYTGFRSAFKVAGVQRAFEEIDRPLDALPPRELGLEIEGVRYGGEVRGGRWLPIPGGVADDYSRPFSFRSLTDFHAGAHFGIVGVRAGFNPLELVDFALGFAGLDIAGDDPNPGAESAAEPEGER
jgi:hypothetical protein